jgi:hypothetical protein
MIVWTIVMRVKIVLTVIVRKVFGNAQITNVSRQLGDATRMMTVKTCPTRRVNVFYLNTIKAGDVVKYCENVTESSIV